MDGSKISYMIMFLTSSDITLMFFVYIIPNNNTVQFF